MSGFSSNPPAPQPSSLAFVHQQVGGRGYDAALGLYSRVTSAWSSRQDLSEEDEALLPDFNNITSSVGLCHEGKGDYDLALSSYLSALKGYEESTEFAQQVQTLANIGLMYKVLGDYANALDYFERARDAEEPDFKAEYDSEIQFCKEKLTGEGGGAGGGGGGGGGGEEAAAQKSSSSRPSW